MTYLFGDCRLDSARRELVRGGQVQAVEPQVLDLILDLIEHRDRVVMRHELHDRVWHGRIVSEATLSSRIKMARRVLGDNGHEQALIRTIHGRGFHFVGAVSVLEDREDAAAPEPASPREDAGGMPGVEVRRSAPEGDSGRPDTAPAERRQLTIVRCSLAHAALALSALDAEEIDELLARAKAVLIATFEARGGYVAQTYPAGILVYFGWPRALEDAARLAVRAALAVGPALRNLNWTGAAPQVRTGVATGIVIVEGSATAGVRQAGGQAPVLATRLMDLAGPGTIIVADSTRELLRKAFVLEEHTSERISELGRGARAWRVVRAADVATRFEAAARNDLTSLVGREEELALLQRRWERAATGEGQVVILRGDAGIGKSRLVHEFAMGLVPSAHQRITCQCLPNYENSPLSPVIREIEHAARLERDDDDAKRTEKIRRLLARAGQWSSEATALITELLSAAGGHSAPSASPAAQQRQELTFETLVGMIGALARERPVLFILEDAHWIDPTTQDLMHRIVDLAGAAAVLVLVTHRPDYAPPWAGRPHVSQLSLSRLTARDVSQMANQLAGEGCLSEDLRAQIAERTDGVPLYAEELTRVILAARAPGEAQTDPSALSVIPEEIPATLRDLLLSQLDGEAGEVAKVGAAIGRSFGRELLGKVARLPDDTLDAALSRLMASGLVFATGTSARAQLVFKHVLVQDAAYQALTRDRRRDVHARIAEVLESGTSDTLIAQPEILARHFEEADQPGKAFACWHRAGEIAARRFAHLEAVAHFRRALGLLEGEPEDATRLRTEAELLRRLGRSAFAALGDGDPETREIYLRLDSICDSIDDESLRCDALWGLSQHAQAVEHVDRSLAIAGRYMEAARRVGDRRQLALAHWIVAQDHWRAGRFAAGVAEAWRGRRAFDARQPTEDLVENPEVLNRTVEAYCACMLGQVERALRDLRAMAEEARETTNPMTADRTFIVLGVTYQLLHDVDETALVVQQMTALSQTHRRRHQGDWPALLRAWVLTAQGDVASGVAHATDALQGLEIKSRLPRRLSILAECFAAADRVDIAQDLIARALVETEARGERFFEAELHRQQGELLLAAGGAVDAAEASFERALAIARTQEARLLELKAAVSLGRLWTCRGRCEDAIALVEPVLATFDDGFDFPDLRCARTLLRPAKTA